MPTFRNYVRAFGGSWLTAMSGPLAVPFAIAAVYVEGNWQKAGLALLAIVCAGYASFSIWKAERIARNKAEDRAVSLAEKLSLAEKPSAPPAPTQISGAYNFVGNTDMEVRDNIAINFPPPTPPKKKGGPE